ncbi:MAG: glycosyl transferase family 2 [Euryarchaeota archaeon RBG_19FT_COMBO_56_21]|nr:MAG: glycosyl transferase family 2 [Euryarchaeota archaeon RBG_19FT_COMBO_56_21]
MKISIVLNLLNEAKHIRDLLDSLVIQEGPFEVIVVDAGSWDGTPEVIKKYMEKHPGMIELYHRPGTRGESTNFGILKVKGDAIATIGGDCIANPFWLKELRKTLGQFDIAAGKTINIGYHAFEKLERVELYHRGMDISYPSGNMAWRKKVIDDVVGFDPWFVTAEDIDMNFRAVAMGYTLGYNENALVYHRMKESFIKFFKQAFWNGWGRKQLTMKHGRLWSSYKPQRLLETSKSMWALARLSFAVLGYVVCKFYEKSPYTLPADQILKRFKFVFPGR